MVERLEVGRCRKGNVWEGRGGAGSDRGCEVYEGRER